MVLLILLSVFFFELYSSSVTIREDAVFSTQNYHTVRPDPKSEGFQLCIFSTSVKAKSQPYIENLSYYFKQHLDSKELEFLVVWEKNPFFTVTSLRGKHLNSADLRILFRNAQVDEESEGGKSLVDDVYSNVFIIPANLSFSFNDSELDLKRKLNILNRLIRTCAQNSLEVR